MPSKLGWSQKFTDSIPLPKGEPLVTLRDAASYITKLPKVEHSAKEWQTAIDILMKTAKYGDAWMFFARIAMLQALHRHVVQEFKTDRKETHWGKRKLARDR
jgi:hypothetical protein